MVACPALGSSVFYYPYWTPPGVVSRLSLSACARMVKLFVAASIPTCLAPAADDGFLETT